MPRESFAKVLQPYLQLQAPRRSPWDTEQLKAPPPPPPPSISRSASSTSQQQQTQQQPLPVSHAASPSPHQPVPAPQLDSPASQAKPTSGSRPLIWLKSPSKFPGPPSTPPSGHLMQNDGPYSPPSEPLLGSTADAPPYAALPMEARLSSEAALIGPASTFGVASLNPGGLSDAYSLQQTSLAPISFARPSPSSDGTTPDQSMQISRYTTQQLDAGNAAMFKL